MALALVVICGLPYLLSALFGPSDLARIGTFWFPRDFSQYQAAMREGAHQSSWLIYDHFSAEPHRAALMYPLYVAAGKLAAGLGISDLAIFAGLEWLGRFAVLGALYAFAATFLPGRRERRLAVLLALGTLGLDAWLVPLRLGLEALGATALTAQLPDAVNPYLEVNSFGVLLSAPHLMLGLALTLSCAPLYLRAIAGHRAALAALGVAIVVLSLVHSFNTPVLISVLVLHALKTGRRAWPAAVAAALAGAPMALYSLVLYQTDPFWSGTYGAQNLMPSPAAWTLPADFGVVLLAAPLAWSVVRGWSTERRWLILLWIGLGIAWMYAPVVYQRRFGFGVQPALAVLAAVGLIELNATLRRSSAHWLWRRAVNYAIALAAMSTSLLVYVSLLVSALTNQPIEAYAWSRAEAEAGLWLGTHSSASDIVLASTPFANSLVGVFDGRVVHGHIVATLHTDAKAALVASFYGPTTSAAERADVLHQSGATMVAFGPRERALGATDLNDQPNLEPVYDRDGVQLFRVR
ncbi:MAG TPA: hypothetical protein VGQ62_21625 [Chloroflexota bacterium]|nr:hypothetical protein [Chloroflexota bacterium]